MQGFIATQLGSQASIQWQSYFCAGKIKFYSYLDLPVLLTVDDDSLSVMIQLSCNSEIVY